MIVRTESLKIRYECYSLIVIKVVVRVADRADIKTGKPLLVHLQNVNNNNNNNNNNYLLHGAESFLRS